MSRDLDEFEDLFGRVVRRAPERDHIRGGASPFGTILREHLGARAHPLRHLGGARAPRVGVARRPRRRADVPRRRAGTSTPHATVIVLSGASIGRAGAAIRLARDLAPALVVLEDGDLVAEARDMSPGEAPLLFEPMNEMEAMADDADVAFVLTTHRADLLALYGAGLDLALADAEAVVTAPRA